MNFSGSNKQHPGVTSPWQFTARGCQSLCLPCLPCLPRLPRLPCLPVNVRVGRSDYPLVSTAYFQEFSLSNGCQPGSFNFISYQSSWNLTWRGSWAVKATVACDVPSSFWPHATSVPSPLRLSARQAQLSATDSFSFVGSGILTPLLVTVSLSQLFLLLFLSWCYVSSMMKIQK